MKAILNWCSFLPLVAACCLAACGSQAYLPGQSKHELPSVLELDAVRQASIIESFQISLVQPHSQFMTATQGEFRTLAPAQDEAAWALFQISEPQGSPDSLIANGSGNFLIAVADFNLARWRFFTELDSGEAVIDLAGRSGLISPGGFFYCAVIAPSLMHGGMPSQLDSLVLVHDEDHDGSTFYVAPENAGGNDSSPGNATLPWATLQHAADTVGPGDTVIVRAGDYEGFMLTTSGTINDPITFSALDGATVIFDNVETPDGINIENPVSQGIHDIIIEGFTVQGSSRAGIRVVGSAANPAERITLRRNTCIANARWGIFSGFVNHMTVEYNRCSFSVDEHGIYLSNSGDFNIARGNVCHGNNGGGIQFNADASQGGDGSMSDALIENNICFNNGNGGGAALNMDGLKDSVIRNNLLYDNHAGGITLFSQDGNAATGNRVICNTIIQAADGRWCIRIANASTGNLLRNNILWNRHSFRGAISLDSDCLPGFSSDYNLAIGRFTPDDDANVYDLAGWQTNTGNDMNSLTMLDESFFNDVAVDDFHVGPSYPGADIGTDIVDIPLTDFDGVPRPQGSGPDAGCYEAQ